MGEFVSQHWGDLASVVGFAVTIIMLAKTRSAARAAKAAAESTSGQLRRSLALTDVTTATEMIQQIMALQRLGGWDVALDKYGTLKRLIVRIREENPTLTRDQRKEIQKVLVQIAQLRNSLELLQSDDKKQPDVVKWSDVLDRLLDKLETLCVSVKLSQGDQP